MADDNNMEKMVTLRSSDKVDFEVSEAAACKSQVLRRIIEDDCAQDAIPIYNVDSRTLKKVIEYCTMHLKGVHAPKRLKTEQGLPDLKQWDAEFINVDLDALYDLINAADYLEIGDLLDLTAQKIAEFIIGKSPDEIRKTFDIENDFSPEEEEVIRSEHQWAFENA